ncbi:DUF2493 domain-containing protein [Actinomadura sp. WMMB 499]|uniref:DUF2493 domain-containing protein n=1 Tax=Actinomadura sp. WMMB 499 TaxID=1219491 RepID=UPI001C3F5A2E|nr:DUF2493 domain-containing protein [Actinomadura sp. WMMB 499]
MKLVVTGSRDWGDWYLVWNALDVFTAMAKKVTLVHGNCPTGADKQADLWSEKASWPTRPVKVLRYPAQWELHGKAAGPIRNQQMVDENLDADYVLAFPLGESRGTRGCMEYARKEGLTVVNLGEKL